MDSIRPYQVKYLATYAKVFPFHFTSFQPLRSPTLRCGLLRSSSFGLFLGNTFAFIKRCQSATQSVLASQPLNLYSQSSHRYPGSLTLSFRLNAHKTLHSKLHRDLSFGQSGVGRPLFLLRKLRYGRRTAD